MSAQDAQVETILAELRRRGSAGLTPLEALNIGCGFRLGARIFDLRRRGYDIETQKARTPGGAVVARYVIHEDRQPEPMRGDQIGAFG